MTSTNKTPNFTLPQWVGTDYLKREEMNRGFSVVDTELKKLTDVSIEEGTVAPSNTKKYWLDTATTPPVLKRYNTVTKAWDFALRQNAEQLRIKDEGNRFTSEHVEGALTELAAVDTAVQTVTNQLRNGQTALESAQAIMQSSISTLSYSKMNVGEYGVGGSTVQLSGTSQLNLNTLRFSGFYHGTGLTNAPAGHTGGIVQHMENNSFKSQLFFPFGDLNHTDVFVRKWMNDYWSVWQPLNEQKSSVKATSNLAAQSLVANAYTIVPFNQVSHDTKTEYNPSTREFIAKSETSDYLVNASVFLSSGAVGDLIMLLVYVNGVSEATTNRFIRTHTQGHSLETSTLVRLRKGDKLDVRVYSQGAATMEMSIASWTFLKIRQL